MIAADAGRRGLSEAIEYLRARGETIAVVDTAGEWVEVINPRDIAGFVLGTKADTLQRLRGVIESGTIQEVASFTVARWRADRQSVLDEVRAHFLGRPERLVVRSSARSEDTFHSSNAGGYDSVLNVDPVSGLEDAIVRVIASYGEADDEDQVLVQPMLENVTLSGVVFTRTSEHFAPWYVINYETSGSTDGVTSGASADHLTLYVRRDASVDCIPMPQLKSLVMAVQEIERRLGYDALDIEFALDRDGVVHIFQVRPIAVKPRSTRRPDEDFAAAIGQARATWDLLAAPSPPHIPGGQVPVYSVMTDWNPAEIIGTAPGRLAESMYRYLIMDETWATQRSEYGYRDLRPAPLLVSFAGRPYVDVRASLASFLPATLDDGLAGRLLAYSLERLRQNPGLHDKVEFDIIATCLSSDFDAWETMLASEGGFAAAEIEQLRLALRQITHDSFFRCAGDLSRLDMLEERHRRIVACGCGPLERARLMLEDCRRYGTLPFAHLARSGFVAVTLLRGAERSGIISSQGRASFMSTLRTVGHGFTTDADAVISGALSWEDFVRRYGHLRPGTYDIVSPRYDADIERFLRPQIANAGKDHAGAHGAPSTDPSVWERERPAFLASLAAMGLPDDIDTVETFLRQAIEGREYSKFVFTRSFSDAIEALAEFGAEIGLDRIELSNLPLECLLGMRDDHLPLARRVAALKNLAAENALARDLAAAIRLPPIITGPGDLDAFLVGADLANFVGHSEVVADCVDLENASGGDIPDVKGMIAMIPQADPGYDWLFGQGIVGLVTMYGGVNSHMAIRAAEFGMSAAIGIGEQRYRELAGAKMLHLAPANQVLKAV